MRWYIVAMLTLNSGIWSDHYWRSSMSFSNYEDCNTVMMGVYALPRDRRPTPPPSYKWAKDRMVTGYACAKLKP